MSIQHKEKEVAHMITLKSQWSEKTDELNRSVKQHVFIIKIDDEERLDYVDDGLDYNYRVELQWFWDDDEFAGDGHCALCETLDEATETYNLLLS